VDRIKRFQGNHYTAFGTALHEVCEKTLLDTNTDEESLFEEAFLRELQALPEEPRKELTPKIISDMREQGRKLSTVAIPALHEYFPEFELVSTEEGLMEPVRDFTDAEFDFKGFIDLVVKTPDGKVHIIDWKTCSWGWNMERKTDPMTTYQLTLYKYFYAMKHGVDPKDIETHFALLKRTAKKNVVEIFRVTSGPKKTENALNLLNKALYNINKGTFIKNKLSCRRCEFYKTPECP
jgi:ATP-dependent exoDNAse (exonuclease V) beta subunit